jgi:hypothetical protein
MRISNDRIGKHGYNYSHERGNTVMPFRINHFNKKTGVTYVCESVSYWDEERKQSKNKQVCIGKLDLAAGAFLPSKRLAHPSVQESSLPHTATASNYWAIADSG